MGIITLNLWHGGLFKRDSFGMLYYEGRDYKTFAVDSDEMSWWELLDLAKKCGGYNEINNIQYCIPNMELENGLRNVYSDSEVREMVRLAWEHKVLNLYVVHGVDDPEFLHSQIKSSQPYQNLVTQAVVSPTIGTQPAVTQRKKNNPKKGSTTTKEKSKET